VVGEQSTDFSANGGQAAMLYFHQPISANCVNAEPRDFFLHPGRSPRIKCLQLTVQRGFHHAKS
jgi:hypothetical protein